MSNVARPWLPSSDCPLTKAVRQSEMDSECLPSASDTHAIPQTPKPPSRSLNSLLPPKQSTKKVTSVPACYNLRMPQKNEEPCPVLGAQRLIFGTLGALHVRVGILQQLQVCLVCLALNGAPVTERGFAVVQTPTSNLPPPQYLFFLDNPLTNWVWFSGSLFGQSKEGNSSRRLEFLSSFEELIDSPSTSGGVKPKWQHDSKIYPKCCHLGHHHVGFMTGPALGPTGPRLQAVGHIGPTT